MDKVLITGGLGYIGSHICVTLVEHGYWPVVLDNLSNSTLDEAIFRSLCKARITIEHGDIRDKVFVREIIQRDKPIAVCHCAGLKAVKESIETPTRYYDNNVVGTLSLLEVMAECGLKTLLFSSSATVYAIPSEGGVLAEESPLGYPEHPYGRSKLFIELMLDDIWRAAPDWRIVCLRYFNPIGAHPSGLICERPKGVPNNIMPYIAQVAAKQLPHLVIYGKDYPTVDGTCVRDFVHVMDIAEGHVAALAHILTTEGNTTPVKINLGTGQGYSVLELVEKFENVNNVKLPIVFGSRRPGDISQYWADVTKAKTLLAWRATRTIEDMCKDAWGGSN